uniref:PB1 domain-containing protein n=1 Tax=Panthera tigris altaica TaxID=74533 RepID=A0A8C9M579_PANTA
RRFSLDRQKPGKFEDFYNLVVHTHHISNTDVTIGYADVHGDLLPINNDDNFCKAVSSANPLLRVFIQKRGTGGHCTHFKHAVFGFVCCYRAMRSLF